MIDYVKAFRKMIRHSKYLLKEELLFRNHSKLMIGEKQDFPVKNLKVLVVSKFFTRNFGDRLGFTNITYLLNMCPNIELIDYDDLEVLSKNPSDYDLVIIGTGNSLYYKMINEKFEHYLEKAKHLIGIFGLQYYETLQNNDRFNSCINLWAPLKTPV